jgi:two-component system chemotaxis sensor kinase CheA
MDDLTKAELDQLLAVFRDQSLQILEEMGHDLLALEASHADADAMMRLRRGAHTIKGDSACVGLDQITRLAHKVEDVFDAVLCGEINFGRRAVDVIFKALDAIKGALERTEICDVGADSMTALIAELAAIQERTEFETPEQSGKEETNRLSVRH